jgi:hypothetical protein
MVRVRTISELLLLTSIRTRDLLMQAPKIANRIEECKVHEELIAFSKSIK